MKIRDCDNQEAWEKGLRGAKNASFFQSWEWGEFQRFSGTTPLRLVLEHDGKILAQAQGVAITPIPFVRYAYFPRFSIIWDATKNAHSLNRATISSMMLQWLKTQGYTFARIEPVTHTDVDVQGFQPKKTTYRQPQHTILLDLTQSPDDLIAQMHKKTRYNIRLAQKKQVQVVWEKKPAIFLALNEQTKTRDKFRSHSNVYYERMIQLPFVHQQIAYLGETPIASNIVIIYNGIATYLHGASANEQRNVMAPQLLQWDAMLRAIEQDCHTYDFWGIAGPGDTEQFHMHEWDATHRFASITRFKAGFGGKRVAYADAVEVPFQRFRYECFSALKKIV